MVTAAAPASEKKEPEDGGWGRDPFVLHEVAVKVDSVENLRLMGITSGGNKKPMAVINNELVPVGAKIGKFEVIEISKKGVAVTDGKKIYTLKLE
jgi:hypothetical protein